MNSRYVNFYMNFAEEVSKMSYAKRLQVGSVIVKGNNILAYGWNGTPSGWDNNCETVEWCSAGGWLNPDEIEEGWPYEGQYVDADGNIMQGRYRLITKPEVLHAEMNCLMKIAQSTESSKDAILFTTTAPCIDCAKLIYQSGIIEVYYKNEYRSDDGISFLKRTNISVNKI